MRGNGDKGLNPIPHTMINYKLSEYFKLLGNCEFNNLI